MPLEDEEAMPLEAEEAILLGNEDAMLPTPCLSSENDSDTEMLSSEEETSDDTNSPCLASAADEFVDEAINDDHELEIGEHLFEPLYNGANITVSGAYCAIMEFKRACRLSLTIAMLLELLQLFCPQDNKLPQSLYLFKNFFEKYSSSFHRRQFCSVCDAEFRPDQEYCDNANCHHKEPNTLISLNPRRAIIRVLKSKLIKLMTQAF